MIEALYAGLKVGKEDAPFKHSYGEFLEVHGDVKLVSGEARSLLTSMKSEGGRLTVRRRSCCTGATSR
jgi:hypothetical protein